MTVQEYKVKHDEILSQIPEEFRGAVLSFAWEYANTLEYDEVVKYLFNLVNALKPAIEKYRLTIASLQYPVG